MKERNEVIREKNVGNTYNFGKSGRYVKMVRTRTVHGG